MYGPKMPLGINDTYNDNNRYQSLKMASKGTPPKPNPVEK
jgi:hypothetical protein